MSLALTLSVLLPLPLAALVWRLGAGPRTRLAVVLAGATAVVAFSAVAAATAPALPRPLADLQIGSLVPTRLAAGVVVAALSAQVLEVAIGEGTTPGLAATSVLLAVPAVVVLTATGLVSVALGCGAALGVVWVRWGRSAGPQLPVRSLARQAMLAMGALLVGAVITPSVEQGAAPGILVAILYAGAVTSLMGVIPFSLIPGASRRVGAAEASLWRVWLLPIGAVLGLRLVAASPHPIQLPLQELLIGLGVASAVFWSLHGLVADPGSRYWSVAAADAGLVAAAVGLGSVTALGAVLLLLLAHWLSGAVLSEDAGRRSQLVAWVGVSGTPPFGGFAGRLLLVLAAAPVSSTLATWLLAVMGLQLAGSALGMRAATQAPRRPPGGRTREAVALLVAVATLVIGVVPQQALAAVFGVHL
ncbi:MAG: hypothetical protein M0T72_12000 [Candidatus Dormibacteraeota bacterium]|nr:hypothetical protein [Candidatus Dormibacteraeota bacterium]